MSLTKLLEHRDVRARLKEAVPKPRLQERADLLAPPQSRRFGLVGTAFDYLLRFHIQRLNPKAIHRNWIAEAAVSRLGLRAVGGTRTDIDAEKLSFLNDDDTLDVARRVLRSAESNHQRYLQTGKVTDALLRSVIGLAQLDTYFRSGFVDENLGNAHREDMRDLRRLISLTDSVDFRAKSYCVLNPAFGEGSHLIRGADADLLIDGMLIEIKTTKNLELSREYFNQMLGYLAMCEIWGVDGIPRSRKITKLGIYFARHASMQVFDVQKVVPKADFSDFLIWFKEQVEQYRSRTPGE